MAKHMGSSCNFSLFIRPQTWVLHPNQKTCREPCWHLPRPRRRHPQTPPPRGLLSSPLKSPPTLSSTVRLQMVRPRQGAARPPGQPLALTPRRAPREARKRRRWSGKRLKRPRATKKRITVPRAKWPSIPAPSWSLTVVVRSKTLPLLIGQS